MSQGNWVHSFCHECYTRWSRHQEDVVMFTVRGDSSRCCLCGERTTDGIYYRDDPTLIHPTKAMIKGTTRSPYAGRRG